MLAAPMILPKEEYLFFIQEATEMGRLDLAQQLLDQAKLQYGQSRTIQAADEWIKKHKGA